MLNGLDLFAGYGGISRALRHWVRTVAYCEIEPYCHGILLSEMQRGRIDRAPIWDDVRTLRREHIAMPVDVISGGFPCQDLSVAGNGKGLDGERSGLFFEVVRLAREFRPQFLFLENVPGLIVRGIDRVAAELAANGYVGRYGVLSAYDVGAPHLRERIWIAAYACDDRHREQIQQVGECGSCEQTNVRSDGEIQPVADSAGFRWNTWWAESTGQQGQASTSCGGSYVENSEFFGLEESRRVGGIASSCRQASDAVAPGWWATEPSVGRVVNGLAYRSDRITALGNGVVPQTAQEAFSRLFGIREGWK